MQRIARSDYVLAGGALLAAAVPRLYGLSDQILLDDEWHGLSWVIGRSGWDVVSSFNPRDNSSPLLNFYAWLLLHTIGWSELTLRLPTLAAGLATAVLLPLLVRRDVGDRAAGFFAFLLAISPVLVFYSRFRRPYSLFALLGFCSLWALHRWSRSASPRHAVAYVVLSTLAVWFHLWALVVVFAPLGTLLALRIAARGGRIRPSPRAPAIAAAGLAAAAAIALVLLPALGHGRQLPWRAGRIEASAVGEALLLLSGSGVPLAAVVLGVLSMLGARALWRSEPTLVAMIAGTWAAYGVGLGISRPAAAEWGLTLIRYAIVLVPLALLLAAVGLHRSTARVTPRWIATAAAWGALGTLLALGPFRTIYDLPNNFANHRAFQASYALVDWEAPAGAGRLHGAALRASEIPTYYRSLSALSDVHAIVEYPFDIADFNNRFYYYQHFHRKRVLAGYQTNERLMGFRLADPGQEITAGIVVDGLLARAPAERLHFANMVDVAAPQLLLASGASHLVLHKWSHTRVHPGGEGAAPIAYRSVPRLRMAYERLWGAPSYEDEQIVVFRIPRERAEPVANAGPSSP